jgi:hypothetical protein
LARHAFLLGDLTGAAQLVLNQTPLVLAQTSPLICSAVGATAQHTGARRSKKPATARELAAMDFAPWEMDHPPRQPGPSGKVMDHLGISARFAAAFVERSKSELINLWRDRPNNGDDLFELMDNLQEAAEIMKSIAAMVETAHMRLLIAVHPYAAEIGGDTWAEVEGNDAEQTASA